MSIQQVVNHPGAFGHIIEARSKPGADITSHNHFGLVKCTPVLDSVAEMMSDNNRVVSKILGYFRLSQPAKLLLERR